MRWRFLCPRRKRMRRAWHWSQLWHQSSSHWPPRQSFSRLETGSSAAWACPACCLGSGCCRSHCSLPVFTKSYIFRLFAIVNIARSEEHGSRAVLTLLNPDRGLSACSRWFAVGSWYWMVCRHRRFGAKFPSEELDTPRKGGLARIVRACRALQEFSALFFLGVVVQHGWRPLAFNCICGAFFASRSGFVCADLPRPGNASSIDR